MTNIILFSTLFVMMFNFTFNSYAENNKPSKCLAHLVEDSSPQENFTPPLLSENNMWDSYVSGQYYQDSYLNPGIEDLQNLNTDSMIKASQTIIEVLDQILISYREGKVGIQEVWEVLTAANFLKGTGFLLRAFPSNKSLTGLADNNNWPAWTKMIGRMYVAYPDFKDINNINSPGFVSVEIPNIENSSSQWDPSNKLVNDLFVLAWAEEFYHVAQLLKTGDPQLLVPKAPRNYKSLGISEYTKTNQHDYPFQEFDVRYLEFDVYAKLLEVLGPEIVPKWHTQYSGYSYRIHIDQSKIKLKKLN